MPEIDNVRLQLRPLNLSDADRAELSARLEKLEANRISAFDTVLESSELLKGVVKQLEPIAKYSYENLDKVVRNA